MVCGYRMVSKKNVLLIGDCHVRHTSACLGVMSEVNVDYIQLNDLLKKGNNDQFIEQFESKAEDAEIIYLTTPYRDKLLPLCEKFEKKIELMPFIRSTAFHPDIINCRTKDNERVFTLMHNNNSAIILYGFLNELTIDDTMLLFCEEVFEHLNYFNQWSRSLTWARSEERLTNWPVLQWYQKWAKDGSFVHTVNHPTMNVYIELSRFLLAKNGVPEKVNETEIVIPDPGLRYSVWPVYPEVAERLGFEGTYDFTMPISIQKKYDYDERSISLREFIEDCFARYSTIGMDNIASESFEQGRFGSLMGSKAFNIAMSKKNTKTNHPYSDLPDYKFWRRSVTKLDMHEIDPVVRAKFPILQTDKVATAGSCFAQHLARTLKQYNFNYFVTEKPNAELSKEQRKKKNYDVYSARYGNIYTTRHLVQMVERINGTFVPNDNAWLRDDERFVDPFRPLIEPNGFDTVEELEKSRKEHFDSVIEMLENLDIFLFTLGLTEAWQSKVDGAVFPLPPGVAGGVMDYEKYEFVNFTANMVIEDLEKFAEFLFRINPSAKIMLTVSPVPMIATYEDCHVITSTTYSKSVLRVAAEEASKEKTNIAYFPSYEVITSNFNRGRYYSDDLRSVTEEGLQHVMRLLIRHYMLFEDDEIEEINTDDIVCEEEFLDLV